MSGTCQHCESDVAEFNCLDCSKQLCSDCSTGLHRSAAKREHRIEPLSGASLCENCISRVAIVVCDACSQSYCGECDARKHNMAKFRSHMRSPLVVSARPTISRLQTVSETSLCSNCESKTATEACKQCMKSFCNDCGTRLHRMPKFQSHQRSPLQSNALRSPTSSPRAPRCSKCEVAVPEVQCEQCRRSYCRLCDSKLHQMVLYRSHVRRALGGAAESLSATSRKNRSLSMSVLPQPGAARPEGVCENCEANQASITCKECSKSFCSVCDIRMHRFAKFRSHTREPISNISQAMPQTKQANVGHGRTKTMLHLPLHYNESTDTNAMLQQPQISVSSPFSSPITTPTSRSHIRMGSMMDEAQAISCSPMMTSSFHPMHQTASVPTTSLNESILATKLNCVLEHINNEKLKERRQSEDLIYSHRKDIEREREELIDMRRNFERDRNEFRKELQELKYAQEQTELGSRDIVPRTSSRRSKVRNSRHRSMEQRSSRPNKDSTRKSMRDSSISTLSEGLSDSSSESHSERIESREQAVLQKLDEVCDCIRNQGSQTRSSVRDVADQLSSATEKLLDAAAARRESPEPRAQWLDSRTNTATRQLLRTGAELKKSLREMRSNLMAREVVRGREYRVRRCRRQYRTRNPRAKRTNTKRYPDTTAAPRRAPSDCSGAATTVLLPRRTSPTDRLRESDDGDFDLIDFAVRKLKDGSIEHGLHVCERESARDLDISKISKTARIYRFVPCWTTQSRAPTRRKGAKSCRPAVDDVVETTYDWM